jgi:4-hydroxy-2-oxoheptanedioate aldolase
MNFIKKRVLQGEFLAGTWSNMGSCITSEMASSLGFDWILLDQEHGPGDNLTLLHQMQAISIGKAAPIVRITWNEMPRFKRALDLGAAGIMVPYVQTRQEAEYAVSSMRYPAGGMRGVASSPRAAGYGRDFADYFARANNELLAIVQIETGQALDNLEQIALVDGVDVLFVGPSDLSISLNKPGRFNDPDFVAALEKVAQVARRAGKAAGILLGSPKLLGLVRELGFSFVALGTDSRMVMDGLKSSLDALNKCK